MTTAARKLFRSREDRMFAGVCGGLGEYFNIDPTLVRLGFVFLGFVSLAGPAILAYLVMMIVVPESTGVILRSESDPQDEVIEA